MTSKLNSLGFNRIKKNGECDSVSEFEKRKLEILKANNNFLKLQNQLNPKEFDLFTEAIIKSLDIYNPENIKKKVWAISYTKVMHNGIETAFCGTNMAINTHTALPSSSCAESGMIAQMNSKLDTLHELIQTVVVITIGQEKPLQVCPNCRPRFIENGDDTKFILASLDPVTKKINQFGIHSNLELLPNNNIFKLDILDSELKNQLWRKKFFNILVFKALGIPSEMFTKPVTADKLVEYKYSATIFRYPSELKLPLSKNVIKLTDGCYMYYKPYECYKGTSASPSPAVISYEVVESIDNTEIFGLINFSLSENNLHKLVQFDPQFISMMTSLNEGNHLKDILVALPSHRSGMEGVEVSNIESLHPYSSTRITYNHKIDG